jgi:hypothetical protein
MLTVIQFSWLCRYYCMRDIPRALSLNELALILKGNNEAF